MRTTHKIIICIIFITILTYFALTHYFHFGEGMALAENTAEWIFENDKRVEECDKIILFSIFPGPSQNELRSECYEKVAELRNDAKICSKISVNYRIFCISNIISNLSKQDCSTYMQETGVYCSGKQVLVTSEISDCSIYSEQKIKNWCYYERSRTLPDINDCQKISADPSQLRWECQLHLARKEKKPELCNQIPDQKWRDLCEVWIETDILNK